jgi:hypothetical protein
MKQKLKKIAKSIIYSSALLPLFTFAQTPTPCPPGMPGCGGHVATIYEIIANFMKWLFGIFGMIGIIAFIISGILYLVSSGNEEKVQTAKKAMTFSIIGVIVGLSGYIVIAAIQAFLSGQPMF